MIKTNLASTLAFEVLNPLIASGFIVINACEASLYMRSLIEVSIHTSL